MDYAKLLARGVGAWVQYEWACDHSGLFSEKYLAQPIGHVLAGQSKNRASAEYTHAVLAAHMKGAGKRPAVDFVVFGNYPKIEIAVESKWFGKTSTTSPSADQDTAPRTDRSCCQPASSDSRRDKCSVMDQFEICVSWA
jgi:hypothetical protein